MPFFPNYTNFKTFPEQINEFDHFVRMVASVFMEHRYVGSWARKYKRFDVACIITIKLLVECHEGFYSVSSGNNCC